MRHRATYPLNLREYHDVRRIKGVRNWIGKDGTIYGITGVPLKLHTQSEIPVVAITSIGSIKTKSHSVANLVATAFVYPFKGNHAAKIDRSLPISANNLRWVNWPKNGAPLIIDDSSRQIAGVRNVILKDGTILNGWGKPTPIRNGYVSLRKTDGRATRRRHLKVMALAWAKPYYGAGPTLIDSTKPISGDNVCWTGVRTCRSVPRYRTKKFYSNIVPSHAEYKAPLMDKIYDPAKHDAILILGAQKAADVIRLSEKAKATNRPLFLCDIRTTQAGGIVRKLNYGFPLAVDLSNHDQLTTVYTLLTAFGIKKPLIYDNTSGGPTRIDYVKQALEYFPEVVFYVHARHGTHTKVLQLFNVIKSFPLGNNKNYLFIVGRRDGLTPSWSKVQSVFETDTFQQQLLFSQQDSTGQSTKTKQNNAIPQPLEVVRSNYA
jgi:hypothetical protein